MYLLLFSVAQMSYLIHITFILINASSAEYKAAHTLAEITCGAFYPQTS